MTTSTASPNPPRTTSSARSLATGLVDDWTHRVRRDPSLDERLRAAGYRPHRATGVGGSAPSEPSPIDDERGDAALADLVRRAAVDPEAARIVLQRLLPGLLAIARRRGGRCAGGTGDSLSELVAWAWLVIRRYPIDRRPVRVAANLLRDIEYQAFTRPARLRRVTTEPIDEAVGGAKDRREPGPFDELVDFLVEARGAGLDDDDLAAAAALASGIGLDELAARRGVTVRAERYRRAGLVHRLREIAVATGHLPT